MGPGASKAWFISLSSLVSLLPPRPSFLCFMRLGRKAPLLGRRNLYRSVVLLCLGGKLAGWG
jgi:hypothetical protein